MNVYPKTVPVLLSSIRIPDATKEECFSLLQCFSKCPIISMFDECIILTNDEYARLNYTIKELNDSLEEEKCLPSIDYDFQIKSLEKKA